MDVRRIPSGPTEEAIDPQPLVPSDVQALFERQVELEAIVAAQKEQLEISKQLLHEVNHRAKNSLQMAIAMLSMQALSVENSVAAEALQAAARRLGYLAHVHEMLYQRGDGVQEIEIRSFLREIAEALSAAFGQPGVTVRVTAGPSMLTVSQAVNVALIAGEAILNAFKYAFPEGRSGQIQVLFETSEGAAKLVVQDDGQGFVLEARRGSLGMRLLRALGRALGGETQVSGERGTTVAVEFRLEALPQRG